MAEIEIEIPWAIQKEVTMSRSDREGLPFLKPSIVECIKQKLGEGTTHEAQGDYDEFTMPDGRTAETTFVRPEDLPDEFKQIPPDPAVRPPQPSFVLSAHRDLVNRLYEVLQECAIGKVSLPAIQAKVAAREGRKGFRTGLGMMRGDGSGLPADAAKLIGRMTADRTIGGKRKPTRKTKKTKKSRKHVTRRRV